MRLTIIILSVCLFFSGCSQKIYDEPKIPIFQTSDYAPLSVNAMIEDLERRDAAKYFGVLKFSTPHWLAMCVTSMQL